MLLNWKMPETNSLDTAEEKSSPNLCVKFFRQCYVAGDALHPLGYMDALREETVKGAQHLGEVPLTVSERSAIRR